MIMDGESQLALLVGLVEELEVDVRLTPAAGGATHPGGACVRLGDRDILFLDPSAPLSERIAVVVECLAGRDELQQRYLPPEIRGLLDQNRD